MRLYGGDAADLLDWLPPASLRAVDLLYPDPWPKRRHWKRRFVGPANLDRLARASSPAARSGWRATFPPTSTGRFSTPAGIRSFAWTAERADDWRRPFAGWSGTRYEKKAIAAGRGPAYLDFRRA